jgi:hypothetical protein
MKTTEEKSPKAETVPAPPAEERIPEVEPKASAEIVKATSATGELAALPQTDATLALEPRNLAEAKAVAVVMAEARICASPAIALVVLMKGRPLGLDAMTCGTKMFAIENKTTGLFTIGMYADLILALTRKHPSVEYIDLIETTAEKCTMVGKRVGSKRETSITWDIDRAKRADLLDRGAGENAKRNNWNRYPENMLRARATSELCKILCPEATMGIDSFEVLQDERDRARTVEIDQTTGELLEAPTGKPGRDFLREVDELKLAISGVKTKADKEEIVRRIGAADLPEAYLRSVREAYAAKFAAKKAEREPGEEG